MRPKSPIPEHIQTYIDAVTDRPSPVQQMLREQTETLEDRLMQVSHDQASLLAMLVRVTGARLGLELGVFTGYSALAMASALPEGGRLIACDLSEEWTAIARQHWEQAGVDDRIELRLGPALETLNGLVAERMTGRFDIAFIDADKDNYEAYYEMCLVLVRAGGLILIDNMFWGGEAAEPEPEDETSRLLRALALRIGADARVDTCLLAIGDGMLMARKRG